MFRESRASLPAGAEGADSVGCAAITGTVWSYVCLYGHCVKRERTSSCSLSVFHVDSRKLYRRPILSFCGRRLLPMAMPPFHLAFPVLDLNFDSPLLWRAARLHGGPLQRRPGSISISSATRSRAHVEPEEARQASTKPRRRRRSAGAPLRRHPGAGDLAQAGGQAHSRGHKLHHRASYPLQGPVGEQATMFFLDPAAMRWSSKTFKDMARRASRISARTGVNGGVSSSPGAECLTHSTT